MLKRLFLPEIFITLHIPASITHDLKNATNPTKKKLMDALLNANII